MFEHFFLNFTHNIIIIIIIIEIIKLIMIMTNTDMTAVSIESLIPQADE